MPETPAVHLSTSARLVAEELAEAEQSTVTALANAARVSKSTVAKALAVLERSGAAVRTVREDDGVREADLWSPGPVLRAMLFTTAAAASDCDHAEASATATEKSVELHSSDAPADGEVAEVLGGHTAAAHAPWQVVDECSGAPFSPAASFGVASDVEPRREPAPASLTDSDATTGAVMNTPCAPGESTSGGDAGRLAAGELAAMVAAVLAAHPQIEYTPTMLSHLLGGRSSGAIHNVLVKMVQAGAAVRTCDKPKRFRHAASQTPNGS
jgi:DNA-binding MarR family transcriptional regulator